MKKYQDESLSFKERAKALVAEMTLEEKVFQTLHWSAAIERLDIKAYNWWNEALHGVARAGVATVFPQAIGLAAAFKAGTAGVLSTAFTDDVGWTGIIVAWLSQLNTAVIFGVSALISMLHYGSTVAAATFSQVDSSFANMLQGAILFLVLAADFYTRFRVVPVRKGGNANGNG